MSNSTVHYTLKRGPHGDDGINTLDSPGGYGFFTGDVYTFEATDEAGVDIVPLRETKHAPVLEHVFPEFFLAEETELPACHLLIVVAHQTLRSKKLNMEIIFDDESADDPGVLEPKTETFEFPLSEALDMPDGMCCLRFLFLCGGMHDEELEFPGTTIINVTDGSPDGFPEMLKARVGDDGEFAEIQFLETSPEFEVTDEFGVLDDD